MYINKYSSNIIKIATVTEREKEQEREREGASHAFDDGHASLSLYCHLFHLPFDIRHCAPCDDSFINIHTSWQPQGADYEFLLY